MTHRDFRPLSALAALRLRPRAGDDRGSLPMALLLIMVGMALAAALLPTLIVQDRATVFDATRMDDLGAAQAGVDAVVGQIRAATKASDPTAGQETSLPCTSTTGTPPVITPITGTVAGGGNASYSAVVSYFVGNPVQSSGTTPTPMLCVAGYGPYDTATARVVPSYALITSTGTDGATSTATNGGSKGRTIVTTYVFKVSNANISGGQVRIYPASGSTTQMCLDTGSTQPAPGQAVLLQSCSLTTPRASQQLFTYRADLTLQLSTAITTGYANGLCLDDANAVPSGAPAQKDQVTLQQCNALSSGPPYSPVWSQQWSFNDNGGFTASLSNSASAPGTLSNLCFSVPAAQLANGALTLDTCGGGTSSPQQAWLPTPNVGNGAASANGTATVNNSQLVNYLQFGRCLDITGQSVGATNEIAYPCKQNPYPGAVAWNQRFTFDSTTGWLYTQPSAGGTKYCLYSPLTEGGFVVLTPCSTSASGSITAAQQVWRQPGNDLNTAAADRYTFQDSGATTGGITRCLSVADSAPWDTIVVARCDGTTAQKWNAYAITNAPAFQNTLEK